MFKFYILIIVIAHLGLYTYGESLNMQGELSYLVFTLNNLFFASYYSFKNKIKTRYIVILLFFVFTFFYGLLRNGFSIDAITDTLQMTNIITMAIILNSLTYTEIKKLIAFLVMTSIIAGVYSYLTFGIYGQRFKPVSYIASIYVYYQWISTKNKKYLLLLILCLGLIMVSGRRTNLLLTILGVVFLFIYRKPKTSLVIFILLCPFLVFKDTILNKLAESEYKTVKRIAVGFTKKDQSMDIRFAEVNSAFKELNKNIPLNYMLGRGVGATYKLESEFTITDIRISEKLNETHHIHFTPVNIFFKYGIITLVFITYLLFNLRVYYKDKREVLLIFTLFILMTIIDSFFRSIFVDIFGVLFIALGLNKKK